MNGPKVYKFQLNIFSEQFIDDALILFFSKIPLFLLQNLRPKFKKLIRRWHLRQL